MSLFFLHFSGRLLAALPCSLLARLCRVLAALFCLLPTRRRFTAQSNLHHAFPDKPASWHRRMLHRSAYGMIETALFVAASPYFSRQRIRRHFSVGAELEQHFDQAMAANQPIVVLVPHCSLMEAITFLPALIDKPIPDTGVIYRPLKQAAIEAWVKRTRERFGLKLLSRHDGFLDAAGILKQGGAVAVLFDQNAGRAGSLTTFFGRVCSTTELPGLLAVKHRAQVYALYVESRGFWRGSLRSQRLQSSRDVITQMLIANQWLEEKMRTDDDFCGSWLWFHGRWRSQDAPQHRLELKSRRNVLAETTDFYQWPQLPRKTRFLIRMPNWLGDVIMLLPLLKALRKGRPDIEISLLLQPALIPLLQELAIADRLLPLPPKGFGYFRQIRTLRAEYFDTQILFTHSQRSDLEAWLIDAPQRFGIVKPGRPRPLLTHPWRQPAELDEQAMHQTDLWLEFLQSYGLRQPVERAPLLLSPADTPATISTIGMICGTENSPEKRWPIQHWRSLIERILAQAPASQISLFGTSNDRTITEQVAAGFPPQNVINRAGHTDLLAFARELQTCSVVICNDTGGMHLANALGVAIIALYGPTNSIRTGPAFSAPVTVLHAPVATTGTQPRMEDLSPQTVLDAWATHMGSNPNGTN